MKKVLLVNGSPRRNGNTAAALEIMEKELLERGLETVWFQLDGIVISLPHILNCSVMHTDLARRS